MLDLAVCMHRPAACGAASPACSQLHAPRLLAASPPAPLQFLAAAMPNDRSVKADLAKMEAAFAEEQRLAGFPDSYSNNSLFGSSAPGE